MNMYRFTPIKVEAIWGYEKWLLSAVKGRESVLLGDASVPKNEAVTLNDLAARLKKKLLGRKVWERYGAEFPLLIKFIHTHGRLSVQVHPSDEKAALLNKAAGKELYKGKTEMWYITKAQEDAKFLLGFSRKVSPEEVRSKVEGLSSGATAKTSVEELLKEYHPKAGESYFVPAGTVHSLGAGMDLIEIQQSSNTTFRLYDFGRVDKTTGKPRRLDIEEALQCIDYSAAANAESCISGASGAPAHQLATCEHFTTTKVSLGAVESASAQANGSTSYTLNLKDLDSFSVIIVTEGEGRINDERIAEGDLLLIPAALGKIRITADKMLHFLEVHV